MTHYGSIGYRSMGTPELRAYDESDTGKCDDCGEQAPMLDLDRNLEELEASVCADCADAMIGYNNGGTL